MTKQEDAELLTVDGHTVRISHPGKLYFSEQVQLTKLDLVHYYLQVAEGALRGIAGRPLVLKRFVNGAHGEAFYQKRAPSDRPPWLRTITLAFPSGRTAEELVLDDAAGLAWIINLGSIELHPHLVRAADLEHPDELRIDLDPGPGVGWPDVRRVALEVQALLAEHGLVGWPKTSGSRGMHIQVRLHPRWSFEDVRRAALAVSRAVERRAPGLASSRWWKEERQGVFLDYNQNARDRTTCSAYSVRPVPEARVSAPLAWSEVAAAEPGDFTVLTMPARFAKQGDPHAGIDAAPCSLDALLALAEADQAAGLGDAPWPPHFRKASGEAPRVAPSRAKSTPARSKQKPSPPQAKPTAPASSNASHSPQAKPTAPALANADNSPQTEESAPRGRRVSKMPLLTIALSPHQADALAGLARWQARYPAAAALLAADDILVDSMRGRSSTWTRIRINLRHVPPDQRPPQETPDPNDNSTRT